MSPLATDSGGTECRISHQTEARTVTERRLQQLSREIHKCEEQLEHAKRAESGRVQQLGKLVGVMMPPGIAKKAFRQVKIFSPGICGEAAIFSAQSSSAYSVVADTFVEVVAIHKVLSTA